MNRQRRPRCDGITEMGQPCRLPAVESGTQCKRGHAVTTYDPARPSVVTPSGHTAAVATPGDAVLPPGAGYRPDGSPDVFNEGQVDRLMASDGEMTPRRLARQEELRRLLTNAYATTTRGGYNRNVKAFVDFCKAENRVPLPADPETVREWTLDLALHKDEHTGERYQPGTIAQMLASVSRWHESHDLPDPVSGPLLIMIKRGFAKTYGRNPKRADPILREAWARLIDTTYEPPRYARRNLVILLLMMNPGRPLGPRPLERFSSWDQLTWPESDEEPAVLLLPYTDKVKRVEIARHADPLLDTVRALQDLYEWSERTGPVFAGPEGQITYSNISLIAKEHCERLGNGIRLPDGKLTDDERRRVVETVMRRTDAQVRNATLLSCQWQGANRRSEVGPLTWADLAPLPEDDRVTRMIVERSKKDQEGKGHVRLIHPQRDGRLDLRTNLTLWCQRVTAILGRPPLPSEPVFFRLDQAARRTERIKGLSGNAVNDIVKAAVAAAGLQGNYSAHSLRAGFATQAFRSRYTLLEVSEHVDWRDMRTPKVYLRESVRLGARNATRDPADVEDEEREQVIAAVLRRVAELLESGHSDNDEPLVDLVAKFVDDEVSARPQR